MVDTMTKQRYQRQERVRVLKLYERPCTIAVRIRLRKLHMGSMIVGVWTTNIRLPGAVRCVARLHWVARYAAPHMDRYWGAVGIPARITSHWSHWWSDLCRNS